MRRSHSQCSPQSRKVLACALMRFSMAARCDSHGTGPVFAVLPVGSDAGVFGRARDRLWRTAPRSASYAASGTRGAAGLGLRHLRFPEEDHLALAGGSRLQDVSTARIDRSPSRIRFVD